MSRCHGAIVPTCLGSLSEFLPITRFHIQITNLQIWDRKLAEGAILHLSRDVTYARLVEIFIQPVGHTHLNGAIGGLPGLCPGNPPPLTELRDFQPF